MTGSHGFQAGYQIHYCSIDDVLRAEITPVHHHTLLSPSLLWETKQKQSDPEYQSADEVSGARSFSLSWVFLLILLWNLWNWKL